MSYRDPKDELPYRNSYDAVARTYQQLEDVKAQGIFGLLRLRWEGWLTKKAAAHIKNMEQANQTILEAKRLTAAQSLATAQAFESMHRDHDRQVIAAIESSQHRMIAEASMNSARLIPAPARPHSMSAPDETDSVNGLSGSGVGDVSSAPPVRPYMTDEQIDRLARRFLANFPVGDNFEEAWIPHEAGLATSVPAQARAEIKERARQLLEQGANNSGNGATQATPRW